jgi:hypothetical protein
MVWFGLVWLIDAIPMGKIDRFYITTHILAHSSTKSDLDLRMLGLPSPFACATGLDWSCEGICTRRATLRERVWSCGTPAFMLRYVDIQVVSATFVCRVSLYASERAVSNDWCLIGSCSTKRKHQHLSYVVIIRVPVRQVPIRQTLA